MRIEWRSRLKLDGDPLNDALLAVDEDDNAVRQVWPVDPDRLADFLNDMRDLRVEADQAPSELVNAGNWGELVIARSASGEVISVDPELYWDGVAFWFRSRGQDPHRWRGRDRQAVSG